jgi:gamma-glutamylcyclotransferase (GGCT)/AIG2-like uncharacterized protein YtfP
MIYFFAYGSLMDLDFVAKLGIQYKQSFSGILFGHEFKTNVQDESNPNFGYANIVSNKNSIVEGVLMEIDEMEFILLDSYECYPSLYSRSKIEIVSPKTNKTYTAWVYKGNSNYVINQNLKLTDIQKKRLFNGFPFLSVEYQRKLLGIIQ